MRTRSAASKPAEPKTTRELATESESVPDMFKTADDQGGLPAPPDLKRGFKEIARRMFDSDTDVVDEFATIEGALSITGKLTPGAITRVANQSEDMAWRAYKLFIAGKIEYESYMRQTEILLAGCRDGATQKLEQEKATNIRTKQITDADVLSYMAAEYPDEWDDIMLRRDRAKLMMKGLEQLSTLATKRCFTVGRMLAPTGEL